MNPDHPLDYQPDVIYKKGATDTQFVTYDKVPAPTRGYLHTLAGAVIALIATFGIVSDSEIAVIGAVVIAAIDLVLVLIYTRAAWRKAAYPLVYSLGGVLMLVGIFNELQVAAIIGLAVAVLGTQFAAAKAPTVIEGELVTK